ncbi:ArsR/SmtB family transcription factor [Alkalibacter mobilis]|uniref:ArsR/SmtB family transcription factor n=1 Tax=Alkalibacter mobilis TaxID=2787712 RepID=UPI0018A0FDAC|nr:metalloregulator ArsR/SmtB family transcription factor [Alkalibacter mobilis]MBF7096352.1 winged helix-turn-helix transcriptional regulator [Alkalibacter mobilis]
MDLVEIIKALGDENRLRIMNLLLDDKLCVCELEAILDLNQSNVSRHLTRLKNAGIIKSQKKAQWIFYGLNDKFKSENELLVNYLKNRFASEEFTNDVSRLKAYRESKFTCVDIRSNTQELNKELFRIFEED